MSDLNRPSVQRLDISALLRQVRERLCLTDFQGKKLTEEDFLSFLDGSFIHENPEGKTVVSPFLLEDKQEKVFYPLFFASFHEEDGRVRLTDDIPVLNRYCCAFLNELGIELTTPSKSGYHRLYDELSEKIEREKVVDRINILPSMAFFDSSILMGNRVYDELVILSQGKEESQKYQCLCNNTTLLKTSGLPTYDDSLFTKVERALDRLRDTDETDVSYDTDELMGFFLLSLIDRVVNKKNNLLIALPESQYPKVKQMFREEALSDFVFEYTDKLVPYFQSEHIVYDYEEPLENGSVICHRFSETQKKYDELMTSIHQSFSYPSMLIHDVLQIDKPLMEVQTIRLDVRDYSDADYEKDCCFLNHLCSTKGLKESYFLDHPFYGLTCSGKRENYDSLELLVIDLISELRDFSSLVSEQEDLKEYGWNVDTFDEYLELSKNIQVLRGYNGFPKKYFRLNQDDEQRQSLAVLKTLYQACSASRLLVSEFFYENIFVQDIHHFVSDYHGLLGKMKVKHKLKGFLKNRKKPNYDALVRILGSYCQAQDNLKKVLPSYIEMYGDNVMTMNGVVEIESNIRYIQTFRKRTEELPEFTIDEPFVKKWMNNRNFRNAMDSLFTSLDEKYQEIHQSLNDYIGYFLDGPRSFSDVPFATLIAMLKNKSLLSYDDFCEYTKMKENFDHASMTLQLAVRRYENEKRPMLSFVDEYRVSLLKSLQQLGMKRTTEIRYEADGLMKEYFSDIHQRSLIHRCERYNRIAHKVVSHCHTQEADQDYQEARHAVLSNQVDQDGLEKIRSTIGNEYPIVLIRKEELYKIQDDEFDVVVLLDSSEFSDEELLSAYQCAEHVLVLNEENKTDKRILSYHDSSLSLKNLPFGLLECHPEHQKMWNLLKQRLNELELKVITDSPYYPYLIESSIRPGCYYGPLPNLCLSSFSDIREYQQYRSFLESRKIALVTFDVIALLLGDEEDLNSLKNQIREAVNQTREEK